MKLEKGKCYKIIGISRRDAYYTARGGKRGWIISPADDFCETWPTSPFKLVGMAHGRFNVIDDLGQKHSYPRIAFFGVKVKEVPCSIT